MNKQKAIEILKNADTLTIQDTRTSNLVDMVIKSDVIATIELIDETQKPVVPQFVAEIIEYYKGQNATLYDALREKNFNKQYNEWLLNEQDAYNKFARAWLDGYEVEREKRYSVKIKGVAIAYSYLKRDRWGNWWFGGDSDVDSKYHTRKELEEAGFGWVFDCEGIDIEEVEDEI